MWNDSLIDGPIHIVGAQGYHLNIPLELLTADLKEYVVEPSNPRRVLCEHNTVYLRFVDEDQARATSLGRFWINS